MKDTTEGAGPSGRAPEEKRADMPAVEAPQPPMEADDATLAYGERVVSEHLDVTIPDGSFTVIIGPNACGKSTLLRSLARLLPPRRGRVLLDGRDIATYSSKAVARRLGLLPQSSVSPEGITVRDLVSRGRFPYQGMLRQWSEEDDAAIETAMSATGITGLAHRRMNELSGGQRQRAWLALVLAQQTPLLLLDEPTTFLDITYQLEVLNLCRDLHARGDYTLVVVLHDLNLAFRYATNLIVMRDGRIVAQGAPGDVVTAELIEEVYGISCLCLPCPATGAPMIVPLDSSSQEEGA